jgi:hypothetical protein
MIKSRRMRWAQYVAGREMSAYWVFGRENLKDRNH